MGFAYPESLLKTASNRAIKTRIYFWPFLENFNEQTPCQFFKFGQNFSVKCCKWTMYSFKKYFGWAKFQTDTRKDECKTSKTNI